jgi:hypothetical protein
MHVDALSGVGSGHRLSRLMVLKAERSYAKRKSYPRSSTLPSMISPAHGRRMGEDDVELRVFSLHMRRDQE